MNYNNARHKLLVIHSQALQKQGKSLWIEDPKSSFELLNYEESIKEELFWAHRQSFILVMKNFIDNIFDFYEFENAFSVLYRKVCKERDMLRIDLEYIDKFQPSGRPYHFGSTMSAIYRQFEEVQDEYTTEQQAKNYVKEKYLEFQKFKE